MDADVREADVVLNGARSDVDVPLPRMRPFDPRTRLLLEGSIVETLLRLAAPNVLVMFVQAAVGPRGSPTRTLGDPVVAEHHSATGGSSERRRVPEDHPEVRPDLGG